MSNLKTPKIRFKGFTDSWEQRQLGTLGTTYSGLTGKTKEHFGKGSAKYITYMNVFSNSITSSKMLDAVEIDYSQNEVIQGDIFFTTSSETPNEVGMTSVLLRKPLQTTYLNSFCFGYRMLDKQNQKFMAYNLRSPGFRKNIILLAQGISRYNISKNKVMELNIALPSMDEQKKLGQFFFKLDDMITLHQRQLSKLEKLKKSCLERMFV